MAQTNAYTRSQGYPDNITAIVSLVMICVSTLIGYLIIEAIRKKSLKKSQ